MTSEKQTSANQNNAQLSTGPKTARGKAVIAKNALKHGILAQEAVIEISEIREDRNELDRLRQEYSDYLQPVGPIEKMLVDKIVTTYWRLRRSIWSENGEVIKELGHIRMKSFLKLAKKSVNFENNPYSHDFRTEKLMNSIFAKKAIELLENLKKGIESEGKLHEEEIKIYSTLKNSLKDSDGVKIFIFFNEVASGRVENELPERGKTGLLYCINKDLDIAKVAYDTAEELEEHNLKSEVLIKSMPSQQVTDRISRYETMLDNQLYKAINELTKLQTLRKGGSVTSATAIELEKIES